MLGRQLTQNFLAFTQLGASFARPVCCTSNTPLQPRTIMVPFNKLLSSTFLFFCVLFWCSSMLLFLHAFTSSSLLLFLHILFPTYLLLLLHTFLLSSLLPFLLLSWLAHCFFSCILSCRSFVLAYLIPVPCFFFTFGSHFLLFFLNFFLVAGYFSCILSFLVPDTFLAFG